MLELIHAIRAAQTFPALVAYIRKQWEKEFCWGMSDPPRASMDLICGKTQAKKSFDCNPFNTLLDKHLRT